MKYVADLNHFSKQTFAKTGYTLLLGYCLVAPLSIALSQILLLPLILYWSIVAVKGEFQHELRIPIISRVSLPLISWVLVMVVSSLAGLDPFFSLSHLAKLCVYLLLPFVVFSVLTVYAAQQDNLYELSVKALMMLIVGQALAGIHTVVSAALGFDVPPKIPGAVTESGQLVLVIPAFVFLLNWGVSKSRYSGWTILALFLLFLAIAWPQAISIQYAVEIRSIAGVLAVCVFGWLLFLARGRLSWDTLRHSYVLCALGSLLVAALVINLKRGPWLGVCCSMVILGFLASKRLAVVTLLAAALLFTAQPVRDRVFQLGEDYVITGGRQDMWQLGVELIRRYPLGVGPANARIIQTLDPSLPPLHRHMHNNLLNVAVESGWVGLGAYLWWITTILYVAFLAYRSRPNAKKSLLTITIALALLGWQVAGFVEYNFGDSEVRLIAFMYIGMLLALIGKDWPHHGKT